MMNGQWQRQNWTVWKVTRPSVINPPKGKDAWKMAPRSSDYDYDLVQTRLQQLQSAHEMEDEAAISFLLRTSKVFILTPPF
jgi:hypothetical protein